MGRAPRAALPQGAASGQGCMRSLLHLQHRHSMDAPRSYCQEFVGISFPKGLLLPSFALTLPTGTRSRFLRAPQSVAQPRDPTRRAPGPGDGWLAAAAQRSQINTALLLERAAAGEIFRRENAKLCRIIGSRPKSGMKLYFKRGTGEK